MADTPPAAPGPTTQIVTTPLGGGASTFLWSATAFLVLALLIGGIVVASLIGESVQSTQTVSVVQGTATTMPGAAEDPAPADSTTTVIVKNAAPYQFAVGLVGIGAAIVVIGAALAVSESTGEKFVLTTTPAGVTSIQKIDATQTKAPAAPAIAAPTEGLLGSISAIAATIKDARASTATMLVGFLIILSAAGVIWTAGGASAATDEQAPAATTTTAPTGSA